ncbi:hypothetical protein DH2020_029450 [Rehmannia glutinosa]|uniref:Phospholipase A-2-activating protein n=1 Tax=Rehmannia glutinosa TaxID=99300 RepID=A0ABR0VNH2_REHGL
MSVMDIDSKEYQLRCQLRGHEDDARGICICGNAGIATSSRDRTVSFVGPLAWIPPNEEFPEGGIISGGMDTLVLVWNLATGEKVQMLKGHKLQVTGIALDGSDIVSVSVDCTLRRWRGGQEVEAWEGHKAAIQAIVKLPSGELVTGSSDMTLKLWKGKSCTHTFLGHTDTVRGVAVMPNLGILSASHDGYAYVLSRLLGLLTVGYHCYNKLHVLIFISDDMMNTQISIRLWALSGELLLEMVGHTSIVYSVDAHVSGLIVSSSEDCSAKIWKDGVCVQSIEHPGCVWGAKFLENGDIVTACSDGIVRIWTLNDDKIADAVELDSFASQLSQYKIKSWGLKLEDLPGLDALKTPGSSDGQTKVVREGDNGVAYSWNMREQKWDKIGEVVDGPDDNMKRPVLDGINTTMYLMSTLEMVNLCVNCRTIAQGEFTSFLPATSCGIYSAKYRTKGFHTDPMFRDPYTGSSAYIPGAPSRMPGYRPVSTDIYDKPVSEYVIIVDVMRMVVLHPDGASKLLQHVKDENDIVIELIKKVTANTPLPANLLTSLRVVTNLFKSSCYNEWLLIHGAEMAEEGTVDSDSRFRAMVAIGSLMLEGLVRRVALDFDVVNIAKAAKASRMQRLLKLELTLNWRTGEELLDVAKHFSTIIYTGSRAEV